MLLALPTRLALTREQLAGVGIATAIALVIYAVLAPDLGSVLVSVLLAGLVLERSRHVMVKNASNQSGGSWLSRATVLIGVFAAIALAFHSSPALAADGVTVTGAAVGKIQVDVALLAFLGGTILPLVTRFVSGSGLTGRGLAIVNAVLSIATAGVAYLLANDGTSTWYEFLAAALAAFLASGSTYSHFWKPVGATAAINSAVPGGIGGKAPA